MIKSQGVFKAVNGSKSVYFDSADVRYLASEVDRLEAEYRRALANAQLPSNAHIQYVYHHHTGSSSAGTGCYTNRVYHEHTNTCYTETVCGCHDYSQGAYGGDHAIDGYPIYSCNNCGHANYRHGDGSCSKVISVTTCGKDGAVDHYDLGCGKTTDTITEARIIYD